MKRRGRRRRIKRRCTRSGDDELGGAAEKLASIVRASDFMETTDDGSEDNRKDFVHYDHLNERENEKGGGERKKRRGEDRK